MNLLYKSSLGEHRKLTDEGYLICLDIPIARIGEIKYLASELPRIPPDRTGMVTVVRDEASLFSPDTMDSFNGKPFIVNHPSALENSGLIDATNWRNHSAGFIQSARRGTGEYSDYLMADLLVNDSEAVYLINNGMRELSIGYTADFEMAMDGIALQRNTRGNHVALVRRGRAGPKCAIGDSSYDVIGGLENMTEENRSILGAAFDTLKRIICGDQFPDNLKDKGKEPEKDPKDPGPDDKGGEPNKDPKDPGKQDGEQEGKDYTVDPETGLKIPVNPAPKPVGNDPAIDMLVNMLKEIGRRLDRVETEVATIKKPMSPNGTSADPDLDGTPDNVESNERDPKDEQLPSSEGTGEVNKQEGNDGNKENEGGEGQSNEEGHEGNKEADSGDDDGNKEDPDKDKTNDEEDEKDKTKGNAADSMTVTQDEASIIELQNKVADSLGSDYIPLIQHDSSPVDEQICESKRNILKEILKKDSVCTKVIKALLGKNTQVDSLTPTAVNDSFRVILETSRQMAFDSQVISGLKFASPSLLEKGTSEREKLMTGADLNSIYQKYWNNN